MGLRTSLLAMTVVGSLLSGCVDSGADPAPSPAAGTGSPVVTLEGLPGIRFGDSLADLAHAGRFTATTDGCAGRLTDHPHASPIFVDDRLVLLWANPPLRTPEGLGVGSPVETVRAAHPDAVDLLAPPDSYRFDGVLAVTADRGYLFLHDGATVQKLIIGFATYLQRLFDEGFGAC